MKLAQRDTGQSSDYEIILDEDEREAAGTRPGDEETVLGLLAETREVSMRWGGIRARARRNSRWVSGDQWENFSYDDGARSVESYRRGNSTKPYTVRNLLRNPHSSMSSRVLEGKPTVRAYAGTTEPEDVAAAEVSNTLISYWTSETDLERKDFLAAGKSQNHGVVFYRPRWDATLGPVSSGFEVMEQFERVTVNDFGEEEIEEFEDSALDEDGEQIMEGAGEREGDIAIDVITVHEVTTDGAPEVEDSAWCVFHGMVTRHEAVAMLRAAGIDEDPSDAEDGTDESNSFESSSTTVTGVSDGVQVDELWVRPSVRIPGGLYAEIVGGQVTTATEYPYDHGQLPLCAWRWAPEADTNQIAPLTHVDDAITEQYKINCLLGAIDHLTETMGRVISFGPESAEEVFDGSGSDFIPLQGGEGEPSIGYVLPPSIPPIFGQQLEERRSALYETFGLTDQMSGVSKVGSGTAARTIAYQQELAQMKLLGVTLAYGDCKRRLWAQVLSLAKQYVVAERRVSILGAGTEFQDLAFLGADIDGRDVRLEASTAETRATRIAEAQAAAQAGTMDPAAAAAISETGLTTSLDEGDSRRAVAVQIQDVLNGDTTQLVAYPDVDPLIATTVVREAIAAAGELPVLTQLLAAYSQPAMDQPPPQEGMPAPGPADIDQLATQQGFDPGAIQ